MGNFKVIYKILKFIEALMDFEEVDSSPVNKKEKWKTVSFFLFTGRPFENKAAAPVKAKQQSRICYYLYNDALTDMHFRGFALLQIMKKIAVITGASSGMGKRFVLTLDRFGQFDEVWAIARRRERLEELKAEAACSVRPIAMDLTDPASCKEYEALLAAEKPEVGLLVNASGFGKFDAVMDTPLSENLAMVDLNCRALMAICQITIPYMCAGGQIINIASVAAFQPLPYIGVYAATKAFVVSYSRALNRELDSIHVMALCPFWTKTEFFERAVSSRKVVKKYIAMYRPEDIVDRAWRDAKRHKEVSMYGFKARGQALLVKILPHSLVMRVWMKQQDLHAKNLHAKQCTQNRE